MSIGENTAFLALCRVYSGTDDITCQWMEAAL